MAPTSLAAEIKTILDGRNYVSFAELDREVEGFAGDYALCCSNFPNLIYWPKISLDASEAMRSLLDGGLCHFEGTTVLVYAVDGLLPGMPVAKRRHDYKSPRWLPVTIVRGPPPKG